MSERLEITYEKDNNYFDTNASFFEGGITPDGLFRIYLIENVYPCTEKDIYERTESGYELVESIQTHEMKRIVKGSINIMPKNIPNLIQWLQNTYNNSISGE